MTKPVDELYNDGDGAGESISIIGQCIDEAVIPEETPEEAVKRLAALKTLDYVQVRIVEAKKLNIPVGMLDKVIREEQQKSDTASDDVFPEVEPWPEPVDGAELLNEITKTINRFMICEPETARATALWIAMTWFIDVIQVAPLAVITAPEMRCGKSQLLGLIGKMSKSSLETVNIGPAALFRAIEQWHPTLIIDEADAFLKQDDSLRGMLNAGYTRGGHVFRCVGDDHVLTKFDVWGAKAIAGIGRLADTLMDRSITLELRRKLKTEQVERIRHAERGLFENLCSKLCRFAEDNEETIRYARPELPDELNDRAQDNWEPLLAIADLAGGEWSDIARKDAVKISGDHDRSVQSVGVELLSDIKEIFETRNLSKITSADLINALCEDPEKSWETYNRGESLTPKQMANRLKEYGIKSKNIRTPKVGKGYEKKQFEDAWERYITSASDTPCSNRYTLHSEKNISKSNSYSDFSCSGSVAVADTKRYKQEPEQVSTHGEPAANDNAGQDRPQQTAVRKLSDGTNVIEGTL